MLGCFSFVYHRSARKRVNVQFIISPFMVDDMLAVAYMYAYVVSKHENCFPEIEKSSHSRVCCIAVQAIDHTI